MTISGVLFFNTAKVVTFSCVFLPSVECGSFICQRDDSPAIPFL